MATRSCPPHRLYLQIPPLLHIFVVVKTPTTLGPEATYRGCSRTAAFLGCTGDSSSAVYGTLAVDGVFDGVLELSDGEYSVERADRYLRDAAFPSVIYRHSDIAAGRLINASVCLSDLLHVRHTARRPSALMHQPFSAHHDQVTHLSTNRARCRATSFVVLDGIYIYCKN